MNAIEIFKKLIGERLTPLIVKYKPYDDVYNLDIEVLLLVLPLRNLKKVRELFLEVRKI